MSMSFPYLNNQMVFYVKADSGIKAAEDLAGKSVAVQNGSYAEELLNGDFADMAATFSEVLGYDDIAAEYYKRGNNYKVLLDKETRFMRPMDSKGNYKEPFDPLAWDEDYTESAAWQATFAVPHDLAGLAECMGGNDKLLEQLMPSLPRRAWVMWATAALKSTR